MTEPYASIISGAAAIAFIAACVFIVYMEIEKRRYLRFLDSINDKDAP